jgi:hypothetical protein
MAARTFTTLVRATTTSITPKLMLTIFNCSSPEEAFQKLHQLHSQSYIKLDLQAQRLDGSSVMTQRTRFSRCVRSTLEYSKHPLMKLLHGMSIYQQAVEKDPLVIFMKGTPQVPQCGFSRAVIQIMEIQVRSCSSTILQIY